MPKRTETLAFICSASFLLVGLAALALGVFAQLGWVGLVGGLLICLAFHVLLSPH